LEKEYVDKKERKFYKFLLDVGVGEKNSLGFGFVNPIKKNFIANI
jgi:CRISPR-associated endoribonuclease Cas6